MSNVYHFMTLRMQKTRKRKIVKEHKYPHNRYAVDELHNLRYEYDFWGFYLQLKRNETKRRYYKRVRADAPKASKIPKEINTLVDSIRRNHQPAMVLDFAYGKRVLEARKKSWMLQNGK